MPGTLYLIPTPLDDESSLHPSAFELLKHASENLSNNLILVEEPKASRRRWINWGFNREVINHFLYFNEHKQEAEQMNIIRELKSGKNVSLLSDGGLPAFCDPGRELIDLCHQHKIKVTSTVFCNSLALAFALSGFDHQAFRFSAFPPRKDDERKKWWKSFLAEKECNALMDTAYRLKKVLEEVKESGADQSFFLAMDLNRSSEWLLKGSINEILKLYDGSKRDFILIKGPNNARN